MMGLLLTSGLVPAADAGWRAVQILYEYADNVGFLLITALGLMIIFGMMGVINMAHGEFMMMGAYIASYSYYAGVPVVIAVAFAAIGVGLGGIIVERILIRRFYGRILMSLVVTFGLSLIISQTFLLVFGPSIRGLPTPFGSIQIGDVGYSAYRLVLFGVGMTAVGCVWLVLSKTRLGVRARATMENAEMAQALGVSTSRMYAMTFAAGSALAGLAGALFAMTSTIGPYFGQSYTPLAFITVVVGGGANVVTGLLASAFSLGGVTTVLRTEFSLVIGLMGTLAAAFVLIRIWPRGLSHYLEERKVTRAARLAARRSH